MMKGVHTANQPIVLGETNLSEIAGQSGEWPVRITLELSPAPRLRLKLDDCPGIVFKDAPRPFEVSCQNLGSIEVIGPRFPQFHHHGRCTLSATRIPCVVLDDSEPLVSVDFSLLNVPRFLGSHDQWYDTDASSTRLGVLNLQSSCWSILITETLKCDENRKVLEVDNGYAITHTGMISRKDGKTFSAEEADKVLRGIWLFLSFAAGGFCGIPIAEGKNGSGQMSWLRWGSWVTTPWLSMNRSWWRTMHGGDDLESAFQGFWERYTDNASNEAIDDAIRWYLESNTESLKSGIILGQVALEKLAGLTLGQNKRREEKTGNLIAAALEKLSISTNAPESLSEWQQLQERKGWGHAPHGLVAIRNDLVHIERKLCRLPDERLSDAWSIGHWYIEMFLLSLFHYRGKFWNRLTGEDDELSPV